MDVLSRRPVQIAVGVIVALALFGGGYAFGSSKTPTASTTTLTAGGTGAAGRATPGAGGGGAANRGLTNGQILAVNSDSITVQVRTGGQNGASPTVTTQLVLVGTGTRVVKTSETDIKLADLKVGDQVTVAGTPDTASGTVSAQAIVVGGANILGDILGGTQFPGRGGAGGSGSPRPSASPTR